MEHSVCVIIPTLNAEKYLPSLLQILEQQTVKTEVLVVDSSSDDATVEIARKFGARCFSVQRSEFDHGGTRNWAANQSLSDYILFLSQDALPEKNDYVEKLIEPMLMDSTIGASYGRQVAYPDASYIEKLTRAYNYPSVSAVKTKTDIDVLGIKAFFLSDVCSAYRRSVFQSLRGFVSPILTNEDMLMAAKLLSADYKIAYQSEATVYHSHDFSLKQQYKRNFDVGAFLAIYKDSFPVKSEVGEGLKMIRWMSGQLLRRGRLLSFVLLTFHSLSKFLGNRAGRNHASKSLDYILKRTNNPTYWRRYIDKK